MAHLAVLSSVGGHLGSSTTSTTVTVIVAIVEVSLLDSFRFCFVLVVCWFFETGSHVDQVSFRFTMQPRMTLNP